jgi:hypothetical protein
MSVIFIWGLWLDNIIHFIVDKKLICINDVVAHI